MKIFDMWSKYASECLVDSKRTPVRVMVIISLQWRHNEGDGVSNHQRRDCLLNRAWRHQPITWANVDIP